MTDPREAAAGSMHLSSGSAPGPVLHSYSDIEGSDEDTATIHTALLLSWLCARTGTCMLCAWYLMQFQSMCRSALSLSLMVLPMVRKFQRRFCWEATLGSPNNEPSCPILFSVPFLPAPSSVLHPSFLPHPPLCTLHPGGFLLRLTSEYPPPVVHHVVNNQPRNHNGLVLSLIYQKSLHV